MLKALNVLGKDRLPYFPLSLYRRFSAGQREVVGRHVVVEDDAGGDHGGCWEP